MVFNKSFFLDFLINLRFFAFPVAPNRKEGHENNEYKAAHNNAENIPPIELISVFRRVSGRSQTYSELLKIKNRIVVPDKGVAKYIEALRCRYRTYHYLTKIGLVV